MAIRKNRDYNKTQGDYQQLPAGGYICRIIKVAEDPATNGNNRVHVAIDIAEGEYKNYFNNLMETRKQYADDPGAVKYPFEGQKWIWVDDYKDSFKFSSDFTGFCTALENGGVKVWTNNGDMDFTAIVNQLIGVVFREEESLYNDNVRTQTLPFRFRSVDAIKEGKFKIPDKKVLKDKPNNDTWQEQEESIPF